MTYEEAYSRAWQSLVAKENHTKRLPKNMEGLGGSPKLPPDQLIVRRRAVAKLVGTGKTQVEIAAALGLTRAAVNEDARHIRRNPEAYA